MTDLSTLQTRLEQAEEAYHQLLTGEKEVSVGIGGYGSTTYAASDIGKLERYIEKLTLQIARINGNPRRGPILTEF